MEYGQVKCGLKKIEDALQECSDAMAYMSEYDIPIMLPENVKKALEICKALREETPDDLDGAIYLWRLVSINKAAIILRDFMEE